METTDKKSSTRKPLNLEIVKSLGGAAKLTESSPLQKKPSQTKAGGRPNKSDEEKALRKFNINFRQSEWDALEKNAINNGMQVAVYVKTLIRQGGGFDEE